MGQWAEPNLDHVIARLEEACQHRDRLRPIAAQAAHDMLAWTWARTARGLLAALEAG